MFCGECGAKNEKSSKFCESCGAKLEQVTTKTEKTKKAVSVKKTEKKPLSKKNKIIIGAVVAVLAILIVVYLVIGSKLKPDVIAEEFFLATINQDAEKLYQYLDVKESEFTTKEMFVKIMKNTVDEDDKVKLANYTVGKVQKDLTGLSTTVTITYVLDGKKDSDTMDIVLVKQKDKKYGIYDNWKVSTEGLDTVKDFQIKVLKDSKIKIEGLEVNSKYLDKEASNETYDVYKMPAMFATKYKTTITLPMGFDVEDTIRVSEYSTYTYSFDEDTLPDKVKKNITDTVKTSLQALYDGAKDKKAFSDIKSTFDYKKADLTRIESDYNSLVSSLDGRGLTSITFKDVTLSSLRTSSDGSLYASIKVTYDYKVSYDDNGETKTHDSNDYDYVYVYLTYADKAFKVIDTSSLNTYFSKYY